MYGANDCGNCVKSNIQITPQHAAASAADGGANAGMPAAGTSSVVVVVRVPGWAVKPAVNGKPAKAGTFVSIPIPAAAAAAPVTISCVFGMAAHVVPITDKRLAYARVGAFAFGPHVLAGLTGNSTVGLGALGYTFPGNAATVAEWVTPAVSKGGALRFSAKGGGGATLALMRLSEVQHETYTVYFNVTTAK